MTLQHLFRRGRALAGVLAIAPLAACTVGPNYHKPELQPPEQHRFAQGAPAAESMADLPWWQVFDDPVLQGLIRDGLANNLDLKLASARVVEARAVAGIAKSFLYPQAGVGFGFTSNQVSRLQQPPVTKEQSPDRSYENWALTGSVSWELDLFGRLRRGRESAVAQYLATEEGRRAVIVTLVGDVADTYFLLRELDLQLDVARRTLKLNDETVTYYTDRLAGGVSNRLEVDQAKANRAITSSTIPDIERQIAQLENALSVLLGRPPGDVARGRTINDLLMPPRVPVGVPAALLARRPDVLQAEQLLISSNADVGAAKALFYPTISLTGSGGGVSGALSSLLSPDALVWSLGPASSNRSSPAAESSRTTRPPRRGSTRRSSNTRRRRSIRTGKWRTRWWRSRSSASGGPRSKRVSWRCATPRSSRARATRPACPRTSR